MKKRIHDTYLRWEEQRVHIGMDTDIQTNDPVILAQLETLQEKTTENCVMCIRFAPIREDIFQMLEVNFPQAEKPAPDSYVIHVRENEIWVYSDTPNGMRYAACAIRSYYDDGMPLGLLYNTPIVPFRAMKTYIPARENIPFFREFVQMCMHYGYNTLIMEVGGAMEYRSHPEINEGWEEYAQIFQDYRGKTDDVQRCMPWLKDSIHWENGGGSYLTQEELKELVAYCNAHGLEVIPEVPCLSHSDYLLTRHPELAENPEDPVPDTYCPSNPDTYALLFDVLEEILEVFQPKTVHIAHDEWHTACLCPKCKERDPGDLFAEDVNLINRWLKERGVRSMIWGDMLVRFIDKYGGICGAGVKVRKIPQDNFVDIRGKKYRCHREIWGKAALETDEGYLYCAPDSASALGKVDTDVTVMNWLYYRNPDMNGWYMDAGHKCVLGNFNPRNMRSWYDTVDSGVEGFAISNWSMLDDRHMQRNGILLFMAFGAMMVWNRDYRGEDYTDNILLVAEDLFGYHYRDAIKGHYAQVTHASTVEIPHALFVDGYCMDEDTDRMGWYRITYADGTTEDVDIFYGLNIGLYCPWVPQKEELAYGEIGVMEPTYRCCYEIVDNETWYKWLIPLKKKPVSVEPVILEQYKDAIKIRSMELF